MTIEVRSVTKRYGSFTALDDVSVAVPSGGLTALLGPSGGGKSTLLRVIAGLTEPDAGTVLLDGVDVTRTEARRRGIGFVFQHYAAFKHMTVFDNVAFGLQVRREPRDAVRQRVTELLELVHLEGFAHRLPSQLSGGQRQRMALARALAIQPRVLLLDEPFGALDAKVRAELREWLRELHDRMHVTTVFVTHDQEEAMELAEQVVLVHQGRVEQTGTPDELYDTPASEFVMGFVGAVTRIGDALVRPHDIELSAVQTEGTVQAMVDRVIRLGFSCRMEILLDDGQRATVQATRAQIDQLDLRPGEIVYVRALRRHVFPAATAASAVPASRSDVALVGS